ncbi:hypothetical protein [Chitinophaga sp. HK235]|uniref:hypothetical protein n=1 Tax=Chitinophaga sp. HK235 TaxID=2952571 RepID=UPI001BAD3110|nr:hypothetical protein [Chitinophaga sp. HK235]
MPRKTKHEEMLEWLRAYRPFIIEVDFSAYKSQVCLLAKDYLDAQEKAAKKYPGLPVTILSQLTTVVI